MANDTFRGIAGKVLHLPQLVTDQPPTPVKGKPRKPYTSGQLNLSPTDAAWLAAIIDGEGSVFIRRYRRKARKTEQYQTTLGVCVCYNTNWGVIQKAAELVPCANIRVAIPSGFNHGTNCKTCYAVETAQRQLIYDLLAQVLPYLAHTEKRSKAIEIIGYIEAVRQRRLKYGK